MEWKSINGYEDRYLINPKGTVISLSRDISTKNKYGEMIVHKKSKILKPHLRGRKNLKYLAMTLTKYASKITGISRTSINNALKGWSMSAGGYVWKYKTNERSDDLSV